MGEKRAKGEENSVPRTVADLSDLELREAIDGAAIAIEAVHAVADATAADRSPGGFGYGTGFYEVVCWLQGRKDKLVLERGRRAYSAGRHCGDTPRSMFERLLRAKCDG